MTSYNILFGENDRPYVVTDNELHFSSLIDRIFGRALSLKVNKGIEEYWMFGDVVASWSNQTNDGLVYLPRQFAYTGQLYITKPGGVLTKYQI